MHKISGFFFVFFFWGGGGTPSDQIFWGYRADAGAESMCLEKNQITPWALKYNKHMQNSIVKMASVFVSGVGTTCPTFQILLHK